MLFVTVFGGVGCICRIRCAMVRMRHAMMMMRVRMGLFVRESWVMRVRVG